VGSAQRFLSVHAATQNTFNVHAISPQQNAPSLQGLSHAGAARSRRRGVSHLGQNPKRLRRGAKRSRALEHIIGGVPLRLDRQGFAHVQRDKDVKIARVACNGRRRETACLPLLAMREFDRWGLARSGRRTTSLQNSSKHVPRSQDYSGNTIPRLIERRPLDGGVRCWNCSSGAAGQNGLLEGE